MIAMHCTELRLQCTSSNYNATINPNPNFYFMALQAGFLPFEPDRLEYRQILIAGFIFVELLA